MDELKKIVVIKDKNVDKIDELYQRIPAETKRRYKFYNLNGLSTSPNTPIMNGLQQAFIKLIGAIHHNEFPAICFVHNKMFWHDCRNCTGDKDAGNDTSKNESDKDFNYIQQEPSEEDMNRYEQEPGEEDIPGLTELICQLAKKSGMSQKKLTEMINKEWKGE